MTPIRVFMIALGTGWLLDFDAWPVIVIGPGVAYILSTCRRLSDGVAPQAGSAQPVVIRCLG